MFKRSKTVFGILLGMLALLTGIAVPAFGQETITLTIAVREWQQDAYRGDVFDAFEAANPGVEVVVERLQNPFFGNPAFMDAADLEMYYESVEEFVSTADVLAVSADMMGLEATRAGYFLDLSPLVEGDTDLNVDDFFPAVWQGFQWDDGIWGIPISANVQLLVYSPSAFDEAGLAYPDPSWTFEDFALAARSLTVYDDEGNVEIPGYFGFNMAQLIYGWLGGQGFVDDTVFPPQPDLTQPEIARIFSEYVALDLEGVFGGQNPGNVDFNALPMQVSNIYTVESGPPGTDYQATLLPGGYSSMMVDGYAVSSGTLYPELSYELIKYMTTNPAITTAIFGDVPARQSMVGAENPNNENQFFRPELSESSQQLLDEAIANGVSRGQVAFGSYLDYAALQAVRENVDPAVALEDAQARAVERLQLAQAQRENVNITVALPDAAPELAEGEVSIHFYLTAFTSPLPNEDQWEAFIDEFVANDPTVGFVDFETGFSNPQDQVDGVDCYYEPFSSVQFMDVQSPTMLNIDPFISADPNFDEDNFIGDALTQMQNSGQTWGYPVTIQPQVLWYNQNQFEEAGVPVPTDGWTVEQFAEALPLLASTVDDGEPIFAPMNGGDVYLRMLMAAYGVIPYDTRENPPTVNLSDPQMLAGIQQVLDLAREGYIDYTELGNSFGGGGGGGGGFFGMEEQTPLVSEGLNGFSFRVQLRTEGTLPETGEPYPYYLTTYPVGAEYTPVAYRVAGAYISADTQHPEACYRFISQMAQTPGLFPDMPAQQSVIANPDLMTNQGEDLVSVYQSLADLIDQPNALNMLDLGNASIPYPGAFIEQIWINQMFDAYVRDGGDLASTATEVEQNINALRGCFDSMPDMPATGASESDFEEWGRQFEQCVISIDPDMGEFFGF